jgi:hypothetical protein
MVFGDPLTQVLQIRSGIVAAAALSFARAAPKSVEQTHSGPIPSSPSSTSFDIARASAQRVCGEL